MHFNTVHASHILEHIPKEHMHDAIRDWFRVLAIGGHLIITVPHRNLYEKKLTRPSKWNADHKMFYTPATLAVELEIALVPFNSNAWRLVYMRDCDEGYNYSIGPDRHATGRYEIECVIKRIEPPTWDLEL